MEKWLRAYQQKKKKERTFLRLYYDLFPVDLFTLCRWPNDPVARRSSRLFQFPLKENNNKLVFFFLSFFGFLFVFCFLFICVANRNIRLQLHTFPLFLYYQSYLLRLLSTLVFWFFFSPLRSCLFYFDLFSEEIFKFPLQIQYSQICLSQRVSSYPSWCVCVCV